MNAPLEYRIGWPKIFEYVTQAADGQWTVRAKLPPSDGRPFKYLIHDLDGFLSLSASGALRDPHHTGRRPALIDNRPTAVAR